MEDNDEEFKNKKSLRNTILDNKDKAEDKNLNTIKLSKKTIMIISIIIICVIIIVTAIVLYFVLRNKDESTPEIEQEFSVTIEVFKYRKNKGEKEHEKPNLNKPVYFLGEDFKCNGSDFQVFLGGKEINFSKNFTFNEEGNYTVTYKFKKKFTSFDNLFKNCYYITKINFKKVIGDNLIDISNMFYCCDGLSEIILNGLDIKNVKKAVQMFYGCSSLANLDLSMLDFSKTEEMTSMFNGCWKLKNLNLNKIKTNKVQKMISLFADCFSLENIDISMFDLSSVQSTESMFKGCYNLKSIQLPTSKNNNLTIMNKMFANCQLW